MQSVEKHLKEKQELLVNAVHPLHIMTPLVEEECVCDVKGVTSVLRPRRSSEELAGREDESVAKYVEVRD